MNSTRSKNLSEREDLAFRQIDEYNEIDFSSNVD